MVNDATWHEVTESEKEEIKKKAKDLLDEFSEKLEKVGGKEFHFENDSGLREEGRPVKTLKEFRETTLSNAPFVEDEFITAEKAGWNK
jgi:hypothetical protein